MPEKDPDRAIRGEIRGRKHYLVDNRQLHRVADDERPTIGLLLAHDHLDQSAFARSIRANNAHDGSLRNRKVHVLHQQLVSIRLANTLRLDDDISQTWSWGDIYTGGEPEILLSHRSREHFLISVQTGFGLRLSGLRVAADPLQL